MVVNHILGMILARLTKFEPQKFFTRVLPLLDVGHVASYHRLQFQEKLTIQTQENCENLILGLI